MKKKRMSYNLSIELLERLDAIPRNELPNKSKLIEQLLELWYRGWEDAKEKVQKSN